VPESLLLRLLPKLIERTRTNQMEWQPLPTEAGSAFIHVLPEGSGSLVVRRLYSTFQLSLRNENGAQLESLGEMQEVAGVDSLWNLVSKRPRSEIDAYAGLEREFGAGR
jgi:hypothetical protein